MTAEVLLDRLARVGVTVTIDGDELCLRPGRLLDPQTVAEVRGHKPAIVAELRRRSSPAVLSPGGKRCNACGGIDRAYNNDRGGWTCWRCADWRVTGCAAFTVLERVDEAAQARYGACLSCGGSIELHGSPDASKWRRVASPDDVEIAAVRYVLASAGAIAREARR